MLDKIFGYFFSQKSFKDKLLNKLIAISFILFQAVFLLILLDSDIFNVSAQTTATSPAIYFQNSTETTISGNYTIEINSNEFFFPEKIILYISNSDGSYSTSTLMKKITDNIFKYDLDTKKLLNGNYYIKAHAFLGTSNTTSETIIKYVFNQLIPFEIKILNPINNSVQSNDINIEISSNNTNVNLINGKLFTSNNLLQYFTPILNDGKYHYLLPKSNLSNGEYSIYVNAKLASGEIASSSANFIFQNTINLETPTVNTLIDTTNDETSIVEEPQTNSTTIENLIPIYTTSTEDIELDLNVKTTSTINFTKHASTTNESIKITATTTFEAEEINFNITGPKNISYSATKENLFLYSFFWIIDDSFPEGEYIIKAIAKKLGNIYIAETKIKYIKNKIVAAQSETASTSNPLLLFFSGTFPATFTGDRIVNLTVNQPVDNIEFFIYGQTNKKYSSSIKNGVYYFTWPTNDFPNGDYELEARAIINNLISATNKVGVKINNPIKGPLAKPISQSETNGSSNQTETQNTPSTTQQNIIDSQKTISDECLKININNYNDCQIFLNLSPVCKEKGYKTEYQCNTYLNQNSKCRDLNLDENACNIFLKLPLKCQNENKLTQNECQNYLYNNSLPLACTQSNIINHDKCNEYLTLLALPSVCAEAEIKSKDKCRAFLANKQIADECKNANIYTDLECDNYLQKKYQEKTCASLGINTDEQCKYYIQNKIINQECLNTGINSQSDCDAYLLKKYGIRLCNLVGINNDKECLEYIFNKYQPKINCGEFNKWECQEIIETKFLGEIANKQIQYNELSENLIDIFNKKISIADLLSTLDTSKTIIPLKNNNSNVKILHLDNKIILENKNSLIQTAPIAIIIDSDGDNLPDDTEKRIGSDPNNSDSDKDGYSDGDEVKNNFNPIGVGLLTIELAPFDLAILKNEILEQPKTTGESSDIFTVNQFLNSTDNNYSISGKAEPNIVVTLYIYSDMPLLVTAKTDEFGNWEYNLKESLIDGEHEIYVAINDNTGRITKKSDPINFFIKEAKAVSIQDFVASTPKNTPTKTESMLNFYFVISIIVVIFGISLFIIVLLLHKNKKDTDNTI